MTAKPAGTRAITVGFGTPQSSTDSITAPISHSRRLERSDLAISGPVWSGVR